MRTAFFATSSQMNCKSLGIIQNPREIAFTSDRKTLLQNMIGRNRNGAMHTVCLKDLSKTLTDQFIQQSFVTVILTQFDTIQVSDIRQVFIEL